MMIQDLSLRFKRWFPFPRLIYERCTWRINIISRLQWLVEDSMHNGQHLFLPKTKAGGRTAHCEPKEREGEGKNEPLP